MPFQYHGRVYLAVVFFATLFLYLSFSHGYRPASGWKSNSEGFSNGIGNLTLGVSIWQFRVHVQSAHDPPVRENSRHQRTVAIGSQRLHLSCGII
jgi:hypothetical protein